MCSTRVRTCMRVCVYTWAHSHLHFLQRFSRKLAAFLFGLTSIHFSSIAYHSLPLVPALTELRHSFSRDPALYCKPPRPPLPPMSPPCLSPCSANLGYVMRCLKSFCNLLQLRRPRQRQPARCVSLQRRREPRVCFMKPIFLLFVC